MHQGQDTLNYFRQSNKTFLVLQVFNTITISLLLGYNHAVATNSQIMMRIPKHILKKGGENDKNRANILHIWQLLEQVIFLSEIITEY